MFNKSNNFLKKASLVSFSRKFISSNRFHTNFDLQLDWFTRFLVGKRVTLSNILIGVNVGLFLYVNLGRNAKSKFDALEGTSWSVDNMRNKEVVPLLASIMGSRRIDDLVICSAIFATVGNYLEILHGRPFIIKLLFFNTFLGIMNSLFWVRSDFARRGRYEATDPLERRTDLGEIEKYRFMSTHGTSMSLVYFFLFKRFKLAILPVMALDLLIWGPYYSQGIITGVAAGMIL